MRIEQGMRFGRLLVIERVRRVPGDRNAFWRCQCDCGQITAPAAANLGRTTFSCGCLNKETAARLLREGDYSRTHSGCGTPEYRAWALIKRRCYNKNDEKYPIYGGRGIIVCDRWKNSFEAFLSDMGKRPSNLHSIDRINTNGDYTPKNCRWATKTQQARNTRRNVYVTLGGKTKCISEWCECLGVTKDHIYEKCRTDRYKNPFPSAEAVIRHMYREKFGRLT